jgi:predicted amidophosphoribosyltransferase
MAICPNCGNQTGEGAVFCDQCGTRLPQPEAETPAPAPAGGALICPSCGAGNVPGEAFCDFCGSPLQAPEPAVEEAVPPEEAVPESAESEEAKPEVPAAAEPPAASEEAAVAEAPAAPAVAPTCPACGEEVQPGEAFCANCGASLAQPPIPPEPVEEAEPEVAPEPPAEVEASPEEVTPAPPPAEAAPPAEAVPATCPACGSEIEAGDAFCSACGFALQAVAAPSAAPAPPVVPTGGGPRLVISASGAEIPLPDKDEVVVGREDPVSGVFPDVDLTPHGGEEGGVSRRHARLIKEDGTYYVEDLDSTNFTFVNKQKLTPKARQQVGEGDEIRFGRVAAELRTA